MAWHELGELVADRVTAAEEGVELAEQVSDVAQGIDGEGDGFLLCRFFEAFVPVIGASGAKGIVRMRGARL